MDLVNLLFTYQGRINRAKWWIAVLIYLIVTLIIVVLFFIPVLGWLLALIGYIAMVVSGIMVGIKRLHDRDKSGWWMLLFYGVPLLSGLMQTGAGADTALGMLLGVAAFVAAVWMIIELGCLRGSIGPNQYGPDPLAPR